VDSWTAGPHALCRFCLACVTNSSCQGSSLRASTRIEAGSSFTPMWSMPFFALGPLRGFPRFFCFLKGYGLAGTWCWGARFIITGAMIRWWPYASWTVFKYTSRERPSRPCACLCAAFRPSASSTIRSSRKSVFDGLSFRRRITHASKNSASSSSSSSSAAVAAKVMASLYTRP